MKTKRRFQIVLDVIMLLLSISFYNKSLISLAYHEIAGLILIGLFLVHIIINIRTISIMCKGFKNIQIQTKIGVIVDFLLILCFAWIAVSGVLISRTILTNIASDQLIFKLGHMFAGGLSIILLGVHVGLHLGYRKYPVVASVLLSVVILCGGAYGIVHSNQINWLSIPFTASSGNPRESGAPRSDSGEKQFADFSEKTSLPSDAVRQDMGESNNIPYMAETNIADKAMDYGMYLGMILSWTVITYWIVRAQKTVAKKKKAIENT